MYEVTSYNPNEGLNIPSAITAAQNSVTAVEQSRAVAETQAAMIVAQRFPRDENLAVLKITKACQRPKLASIAKYKFKRGGQWVEGPSIRIAETIAKHWGNLHYGFREISRQGDSSEVEAYCWDLETNVKAVRTFSLNHIRDKKEGGQLLTSERDKYELVANYAQRRVRACILEIIPSDIVDAALEECDTTKKNGDGKPIEDRIRGMVKQFDSVGVSIPMLESYLKHPVDLTTVEEISDLITVFASIKDNVAKKEDYFTVKPAPINTGNTSMYESQPELSGISEQLSGNSEQLSFREQALERYKTLSEKYPDIAKSVTKKDDINILDAETIHARCDVIEDEAANGYGG